MGENLRNKVLVVDIYPDKERDIYHVVVEHATRNNDNINPVSEDNNIVSDMATLCEALCMLIHTAEQEGIKSSPESLKDCMNHLEQGFADPNYFGKITDHIDD